MSMQVRGVNVSVTRLWPGDYPGKIARLAVGGYQPTAGVAWLDAGQVDELIGLLQRCKHGSAGE